MEREYIRDRTPEGHESARARGKAIGGATVTDEAMLAVALHLRGQEMGLRDIAASSSPAARRRASIPHRQLSCACSVTTTRRPPRRRRAAAGSASAPGGGHADRPGIRGHRQQPGERGWPAGPTSPRQRWPPPRTAALSATGESLWRVLIELMRAAGLVRRIGTNIGQAAAKLHATGQPTGDLPGYAAGTIRRAGHIDQVADAVRKALG